MSQYHHRRNREDLMNRLTTLALIAAFGVTACQKQQDQAQAQDSTARNLTLAPAASSATMRDVPDRQAKPPATPRTRAPAQRNSSTTRPNTPPAAPAQLVAGVGTKFDIAATDTISSRTAKVGDAFTARVMSDVKDVSGQVVIPAGSTVHGTVTAGKPAPNPRTPATLTLRVSYVTLRAPAQCWVACWAATRRAPSSAASRAASRALVWRTRPRTPISFSRRARTSSSGSRRSSLYRHNSAVIRTKLSVMMFLQFFIWGAWYTTIAVFMTNHGMERLTYWPYTVNPIAAIVAPFFLGLVADRYFATEKVLGVLHVLGGIVLFAVPRFVGSPLTFILLLLVYNLCYMPTLGTANRTMKRGT